MRAAHWAAGLVLAGITLTATAAEKIFDPSRDPAQDLQAAERQAQAEGKNILMDVGGNWCPWCLLLDRTLAGDAGLHSLLEQNFVVLRVNWSEDNQNAAFLRRFPRANGYPAWYILSARGKLLKAEDTSELEQNHKLNAGYSRDALQAFLSAYTPRR